MNIPLHASAENQLQTGTVDAEQHNPNDAGVRLNITGEQTIRTADRLHEKLAQYLGRGLDMVVDLSGVDECDTTALQLLYALRLSAVQGKRRFHITAASPAITETAAALGLCIEALTTAWGPATTDGDCDLAGNDNGI